MTSRLTTKTSVFKFLHPPIITTWKSVTLFGEEEVNFTESPSNFTVVERRNEVKREKRRKSSIRNSWFCMFWLHTYFFQSFTSTYWSLSTSESFLTLMKFKREVGLRTVSQMLLFFYSQMLLFFYLFMFVFVTWVPIVLLN